MKISENKRTTITDIDILVVYKSSAIIFQVKSKKLTSLSKNGNILSMKSDFLKAVHAYHQGILCRECLINSSQYVFIDSDKKNLIFNQKINECFIMTIVLDDYPAITHQTNIFIAQMSNDAPVAVNVFDLEIIAKYLNTPDKFLDYISN